MYIAYPPLYKVRQNKKLFYCYSDEEMRELTENMSGAKPTTQRREPPRRSCPE